MWAFYVDKLIPQQYNPREMKEWIDYQASKGNTFAAEAGSRLLNEFGDIRPKNGPASRVWVAAKTLERLQSLGERSREAEELVASVLTEFDPLDNGSDIIGLDFEISSTTWLSLVNPDQVIGTRGDMDARKITFEGLHLDSDPYHFQDNWQIFGKDEEGTEWRVPVDSLIGVISFASPPQG